jgi:Sec-independent protein translocase protein TatA
MDILGIGIQEILFILVIALIIFGPKDIVKAGQVAGRFLRKFITSPTWRTVQNTSRELRNLPNKLMREAGLEEIKEDLNQIHGFSKPLEEIEKIKQEIEGDLKNVNEGLSAWTTPSTPPHPNPTQNTEDN